MARTTQARKGLPPPFCYLSHADISRYLEVHFRPTWTTKRRPILRRRAIYGALIALICIIGIAAVVYLKDNYQRNGRTGAAGQEDAEKSVEYVFGSYYDLKVLSYPILKAKIASGGGLALVGDNRVLLTTGDGDSYLLFIDEADLRVEPLNIKPPLDVRTHRKLNPKAKNRWYRVTDIILEKGDGNDYLLYAATTHWDRKQKCYTLRLSEAKVNFETPEPSDWIVRFETSPCLKTRLPNETGGRLAFAADGSILMTTGNFRDPKNVDAEAPDYEYGKVIEINRDDWTTRIFTKGHRNPQGLLADGGEIYETEHGPQGGDELNLLTDGADYGWPKESYGTDYGQKTFSNNTATGDHSKFKRPVFAWIPSIGVSNLVKLHGDTFPAWKGDLMVASKTGSGNGKSLYRVRMREGRAVVVERLITGERIEDLVELPDGRLVLWNGVTTIQVVEGGNQVFSACIGCHAVRKEVHGIGPDLMGVVGSKVARHKNYDYSEAMVEFGGTWTRERLDKFLTNPQATVPGTTMDFEGIADPATRKKIVDYLEEMTQHWKDAKNRFDPARGGDD